MLSAWTTSLHEAGHGVHLREEAADLVDELLVAEPASRVPDALAMGSARDGESVARVGAREPRGVVRAAPAFGHREPLAVDLDLHVSRPAASRCAARPASPGAGPPPARTGRLRAECP